MVDASDLYDLLKEIFLLLDDGDRQLLNRYNLTVPRFYALVHLGQEPGLAASQLSRRMLCDKSNITRLIKGMEAEALVYRRPHETDGRVLRLFLTPAGDTLRAQVLAEHRSFNRQRFAACLAEGERTELFTSLRRLKTSLRGELVAMNAG